jgi:hypothetical protein
MFRRYHHGHSALLGFLLALALERHALTFALLVFAAGLVAGRAWSFWADTVRAIRNRLLVRSQREPIDFTPQPVYSRRGRVSDEQIPF